MKIPKIPALLLLALGFIISGCVVRSYPVTKDRVDQDLSIGNQGYLTGEKTERANDRPATRSYQAVEVELHSPIKFERMPKSKPVEASEYSESQEIDDDREAWGNRGYITKSISPEELSVSAMEKYTVKKSDTLQKISQQFFGTTKKWMKIFEANKGVLKAPNKIYPGQVIDIPVEALKEPKENLK
jgi:nucleoid-associated protein YgaU